MPQNIVVIYHFSLKPNVSTDDLMEASQRLDELMLRSNGFLYRSLTLTAAGQWQDIIYWEDVEAMEQGSQMENNPDFMALMSLIDSTSASRTQAAVYSSACPEMGVDESETKVA